MADGTTAQLGDVLHDRPARAIVVTALLDSIGTGLFLAGSVVFFTRSVGLTSTQVGVGLTIASAAGFVATVPLGVLGDRFGAHGVLVTLQLWRALCLVGLAFARGPVSFVLFAACQAIAESAVPPMMQAVVAGAVGDERRLRTMAVLRAVRNIGFSVGALLAVPLLSIDTNWGYRSVVLGDAVSFVVAAMLLNSVRLLAGPRSVVPAGRLRDALAFRDGRYLALTALNGLFCLHLTLLSVAIPLWVIRATQAPVGVVPLLIVVNTMLAVILQVPLSAGAERLPGAVRAVQRAGWALAGCCVAMATASVVPRWGAVGVLMAGMVLVTLGELWQSAGAWALSYEFAPPGKRVQYLSVFGLGPSVQDVAGPVLLTAGVIGAGWSGWVGLAAVFVVGVLLVRPVVAPLAARWTLRPADPMARSATPGPVGHHRECRRRGRHRLDRSRGPGPGGTAPAGAPRAYVDHTPGEAVA